MLGYGLEIGLGASTELRLHMAATGAALGYPVSRVWKGYWQR